MLRFAWNRYQPSQAAAFIARNHLIRGFSSLTVAQETGLRFAARRLPAAFPFPVAQAPNLSGFSGETGLRFAARRLPAAFPFLVVQAPNLSGFSRGFSSLTAAQDTGLAQQTPPSDVPPPGGGDDGGGADALVIILPTSDVPPPGGGDDPPPGGGDDPPSDDPPPGGGDDPPSDDPPPGSDNRGGGGGDWPPFWMRWEYWIKEKGAFIAFVVLTARILYLDYTNAVPGSVASIHVMLEEKQKVLALMDEKLDSAAIQMVELDEKLNSGSKRMELLDSKLDETKALQLKMLEELKSRRGWFGLFKS